MNKTEKNYLFYLLSKLEYSQQQLREKLLARNNISTTEIEQLLEEFADQGWQSDSRYIKGLLSKCLSKYYGLARIRQKVVYEKKMPQEVLDNALATLEVDWFELAKKCYLKKYADKPIIDEKDKYKRLQYLLRYGHTFEMAQYALSQS